MSEGQKVFLGGTVMEWLEIGVRLVKTKPNTKCGPHAGLIGSVRCSTHDWERLTGPNPNHTGPV